MSDDYVPTNKSELVFVIKKERGNLESLLNQLTSDQKKEKGVEAEWSIKDIMAHIAAWERLAQDRLNSATTGEKLKIPVIESDNFVDIFNAEVYESNKESSIKNVETEFHNSYNDFMRQIETLEEEFLIEVLPFDWAGDLTAQVLISANSHWHYLEHAKSINAWVSTIS